MSRLLKSFYEDVHTREEVRAYLVEFLKEEGIRKIFDKEETASVAEAKEIIDKAFDNLETMFGNKPKSKTINPAR